MNLLSDPRHYQITCLSTLLLYGTISLDFEVSPPQILLTLLSVQVIQYLCCRLWRQPFEWRSAMISGLSLCLLLRVNTLALVPVAALIAIGSKFVIRVNGQHIFTPTCLALVAMIGLDLGWVSPGQWGNGVWLAFAVACLGGMVTGKAARRDITVAFLAFWLIGLFGRSWWIYEPMTIPLHRVQSGALLLFSFFMISDPRATPNTRAGRVLFAAIVAGVAWYIQFKLFRTNALLWSLAGISMLTPLINRLFGGGAYRWDRPVVSDTGPALTPALSN